MALNGVAILGVVLSHVAGLGQIALLLWTDRYLPPTVSISSQMHSFTYYFYLVIRQLVTFCVPVFLVVSGFFITYATKGKNGGDRWRAIRSRVTSLLIPYIIWSIIIWIYEFFINHIQHTALDYFLIFISTGADDSYYFIPLLCYLLLLSFFLVPLAIRNGKKFLVFLALIQLVPLIIQYSFVLNIYNQIFVFIASITPPWSVPRWIFYFGIGIFLGLNLSQVKAFIEAKRILITLITIVFGIASIIEPELIFRSTGWDLRFVAITISTTIYSIGFIFTTLLWWPDRPLLRKPLSWLGGKSYGIYLVHEKSMEFIARLTYHFIPWLLGNPILYLPLLIAFGLGVPVALIIGFLRTPARRYYSLLFG